MEFNVPDWALYIAADYDGCVLAYCTEPTIMLDEDSNVSYTRSSSDGEIEYVGMLNQTTYPIQEI